jgi:phosphoesterase RecJ-like protein
MDLDLRRRHRASADDTQSFLNQLLLLKDAEVVCLFREEDDGKVRVSIKSKGRVVVNRVAMELGGGGHDYAAGCQINSPLPKALETVTEKLQATIDAFERFGR